MAYVGEGVTHKQLFFRYSGTAEFDPYAMSGQSAALLLGALMEATNSQN